MTNAPLFQASVILRSFPAFPPARSCRNWPKLAETGRNWPKLADQGRYLASEASFYRILRSHGQHHHRGRSKSPVRRKPPTSYKASAPCQVWTWDITWMPGPVAGMFFYLYLIVDIFSRKIVGWEVHEREGADLAAMLVQKAVWSEACISRPLVLHADPDFRMGGAP